VSSFSKHFKYTACWPRMRSVATSAFRSLSGSKSGHEADIAEGPSLSLNVVSCETAVRLESRAKRKCLARAQNVADDLKYRKSVE
jgi:hypothetical protein